MKAVQAIVNDKISANQVFLVKEIVKPFFSTDFHFHRECQLVYVVQSSGQRIVGDSVEPFEDGELVFLGSDVPHVWHNEKKYFQGSGEFHAHSLAMYIFPDRLIETMAAYGNKQVVESWLSTAQRGIIYSGKCRTSILEQLDETFRHEGLAQVVAFMKLIHNMIYATEFRLLASANYVNSYPGNDNPRMDKLFKFIFLNYRREISLKEVASVANMNEFSFCRYFKSRTQKTFIEFVNELRIAQACKQMLERNENIELIANECGFNNLTHFNKLFKRIKGVTPKEYRKQLF
ncbi:AraC-like DNA-binding protein [Spirosoma lacussanchae]|uniref:AraC family transcriptional regulator n=1 Tax=Spirosoma lacussanchae TaxID=1884249 RepID=UPI001108E7ED|nr:AraC family transcriptional regulator [Spirosoma lacussanchae]